MLQLIPDDFEYSTNPVTLVCTYCAVAGFCTLQLIPDDFEYSTVNGDAFLSLDATSQVRSEKWTEHTSRDRAGRLAAHRRGWCWDLLLNRPQAVWLGAAYATLRRISCTADHGACPASSCCRLQPRAASTDPVACSFINRVCSAVLAASFVTNFKTSYGAFAGAVQIKEGSEVRIKVLGVRTDLNDMVRQPCTADCALPTCCSCLPFCSANLLLFCFAA